MEKSLLEKSMEKDRSNMLKFINDIFLMIIKKKKLDLSKYTPKLMYYFELIIVKDTKKLKRYQKENKLAHTNSNQNNVDMFDG